MIDATFGEGGGGGAQRRPSRQHHSHRSYVTAMPRYVPFLPPPPFPPLPCPRVIPPPSLMPSFSLSGLVLWPFDSLIPFCQAPLPPPSPCRHLHSAFPRRLKRSMSPPTRNPSPPFAEATYLRPPSKGKRPLLAFFSTLLTRFSGPPRTECVPPFAPRSPSLYRVAPHPLRR